MHIAPPFIRPPAAFSRCTTAAFPTLPTLTFNSFAAHNRGVTHLGEEAYDQNLSLKRAETIRDALLNDGFGARAISIEGRGYQVPLVPTSPHTAEPRNRRVEITTR